MVRAGPDPETDGVVRIDLKRKIACRTVGKQLQAWAFGVCRRARSIRSDPDAQEAFKKTSPQARSTLPETQRNQPGWPANPYLGRAWNRPRAPRDTRYIWSYIFGAVCPERAEAAALIMPHADTQAMSRISPRSLKPSHRAHMPFSWRWLARFKHWRYPRQHHTAQTPCRHIRAGTQPDRKCLGLSACQQTRHLRLRQL